jgi:carboxyl-terminal processing protease
MRSRTRLFVLSISIPVTVFAVIGGYLGRAMAQGDNTFRSLRVFQDVVELVLTNYVEPVDITRAMRGAMRGLSDGLDPDSAHLAPDLVKSLEGNVSAGPADIGVEVTRQYYLRVVSARDGSPAAKAGIRAGDYIRGIDDRPTRDMSAYEGSRLLQGAVGSRVSLLIIRGNAAEPHMVDLVRERIALPEITTRMADASTGYIRVAEFSKESPSRVKQAVDALGKTGAIRYVIDLRGTARGDLDDGVEAARLFVRSGTLAVRQGREDVRENVATRPGDGAITAPVVLVVDRGTSGAAEVFAAALQDNDRADLVGEHTLGRAARQRLVKLPDASALWLTYLRYLTPDNDQIHETGLEPDVEVDQPEVEFGMEVSGPDTTLQKALEEIADKKAA